MPAPFMVAALAAGATWLTSSVLGKLDFSSDDLSHSFEVGKKADGTPREIPTAAVVGGAGLLSVMFAPAWLGAVGMGAMFGALSSWGTSKMIMQEVESAQKLLVTGGDAVAEMPNWLEDLAVPKRRR